MRITIGNGLRLAVCGVFALTALACAAPRPSLTPPAPASQPPSPAASPYPSFAVGRIVCGTVPRESCEAIVRLVVQGQPDLSTSPLAVVDFGGDEVVAHYGSYSPVLVALQAVGDRDYWMNPPTWVVTGWSEQFSLVQEWRVDPLPAEFSALLRSTGLIP